MAQSTGEMGMLSGCGKVPVCRQQPGRGGTFLLQPQESGFGRSSTGAASAPRPKEQVNLLYLAFTCTVPSSPSCQT